MGSFRSLAVTLLSGSLLFLVFASAGASPSRASKLPYGGIGATVANFYASNPHGKGKPPVGTTYYRVGTAEHGRVIQYSVVVGWRSGYRASAILRRLTGRRELPSDAHVVQPYDGYCAIYRSRWLSRVTHLHFPYVIVYAPTRAGAKRANVGWPWNFATSSMDPACRG
jgi:hypothetical protein